MQEDLRVHVFDPVRSPRPRTLPAPPPPVPVLSLHLVPPPPRLPPLQRPFPGGRLEDGAALGSPKRGRGGESSESEPSPKRWPSSASGYFTDDSPSPRSTVSRAQAQGDPAPGTGARSRLATQPAAAPGQGEQAGAPPGGRTSAYRGVSRHRLTQRWEASLWLNGRQLYLGGFNGQEEAAAAYDLAALACKGLGAMTNHPPEEYTEQLAEIAGLTRVSHGRRWMPVWMCDPGPRTSKLKPRWGSTDELSANALTTISLTLAGRGGGLRAEAQQRLQPRQVQVQGRLGAQRALGGSHRILWGAKEREHGVGGEPVGSCNPPRVSGRCPRSQCSERSAHPARLGNASRPSDAVFHAAHSYHRPGVLWNF